MNKFDYLLKELQALQARTGTRAALDRLEAEQLRTRVNEEATRNDETDMALVEVGGIAADNAVTTDEIMTALVELAGLLAETEIAQGGNA